MSPDLYALLCAVVYTLLMSRHAFFLILSWVKESGPTVEIERTVALLWPAALLVCVCMYVCVCVCVCACVAIWSLLPETYQSNFTWKLTSFIALRVCVLRCLVSPLESREPCCRV